MIDEATAKSNTRSMIEQVVTLIVKQNYRFTPIGKYVDMSCTDKLSQQLVILVITSTCLVAVVTYVFVFISF